MDTKKEKLAVVGGSNLKEDEARELEVLLRLNDIPATKEKKGETYTVLVDENLLEEANIIIESQAAYDDFYGNTNDDDDFDELCQRIYDS